MQTTAWHITFGAYGARLHGDERPTVDRLHNQFCTPYLPPDPEREDAERMSMSAPPVVFTREQQEFIESVIPALCERGEWVYVTCAGAPDHVHVLLKVDSRIHGKRVRMWLKRWLTEALSERWTAIRRSDGMSWFGEGGSNRAVRDDSYFLNVKNYINAQRATPVPAHGRCESGTP